MGDIILAPAAGIVPVDTQAIVQASLVADAYAERSVFADFTSKKAANTLIAHRSDLANWAEYIAAATGGMGSVTPDTLMGDADAWRGVTHGLVTGFVKWMLARGYSIGSINRGLSTVKKYAALAVQANVIPAGVGSRIQGVKGYSHKEALRVDEQRTAANGATRRGAKKAAHVTITPGHAAQLKEQPATSQGRRDAVIMAILLDHGLRVGELRGLLVQDFDLAAGTFTFYRPKVDKRQTHRLTLDSLRAVAAWMATDAPASGFLLRGSRKGGELLGPGMTERAITARVSMLGEAVGLAGLSAHDCRHYWATRAAGQGTDAFVLRDAGGWSSLAMPSRYVEAATIANERVKL